MKLKANLNEGMTSSCKPNLSVIWPCLCSQPSLQKIHREHHFLWWRPVQMFLINLSHTALRNGWFKYLGEASERTDCHQLIPQACICTWFLSKCLLWLWDQIYSHLIQHRNWLRWHINKSLTVADSVSVWIYQANVDYSSCLNSFPPSPLYVTKCMTTKDGDDYLTRKTEAKRDDDDVSRTISGLNT